MKKLSTLQIRQLDETLKPFQALRMAPPPPHGWIRAVRESLGMSLRQLGERAGLSKTSVASVESLEGKGTVQLDSIRRLADSMDCDFVYALVPRQTLQKTIEDQARSKARKLVDRISISMELEEQGISSADRERQVNELAEEILRSRERGLWDV
jgi:predicted DNA-binding mobile mystery protein A